MTDTSAMEAGLIYDLLKIVTKWWKILL